MGRSEARIFTSIWKDSDFTALPHSAQWLYMFLLSQPDLAYCGVLPLRESRWAAKAGDLTIHGIETGLKTLEDSAYPSPNPDRAPFLIVDRDAGEVLIRSLIRRDGIWKQPNLLKQARDSAEQIESPRIRAALLAELRRLPVEETASGLVIRVIEEFAADLEKTCPDPAAYPSANPSSNGSGNPPDDPSQGIRGIGEGYGSSTEVSPVPHNPGTPPSSSPPRDRKLGTRIPDDFAPDEKMAEWFRENCPHVDYKSETEQFCDWWRSKPGKEGRKLDWVATWRNWMRTAENRAMPRQRRSGRQQETDDLFADAARRIEHRKGTAQ